MPNLRIKTNIRNKPQHRPLFEAERHVRTETQAAGKPCAGRDRDDAAAPLAVVDRGLKRVRVSNVVIRRAAVSLGWTNQFSALLQCGMTAASQCSATKNRYHKAFH